LVRSKIHKGFKFCVVNKRMFFVRLTNLVFAIREDNPYNNNGWCEVNRSAKT
jgi:hypothetical protein